MRIGQGIDVHAFSDDPSRPLVLGGVVLPGEQGLAGHSDADVLCHAVIDALLGAAVLGDIGRHFPSDDVSNENVSSLVLLERTVEILTEAGYVATSVDTTVIAQGPRLEPHFAAMASLLSQRVGCSVSVKATTTDRLGFLGRREGIGSLAIALIEER